MQAELLCLQSPTPGTQLSLQVLRFGTAGTGPKAYIQGALHADEVPAILVTRQLAHRLAELEAQGAIHGEIVLVPFANPIGLAQQVWGAHQGRFDLRDGGNFNRGHAELAPWVVDALGKQLTLDAPTNTRLIRSALKAAADAQVASHSTQDLKNQLLRLAVDADIVLDLLSMRSRRKRPSLPNWAPHWVHAPCCWPPNPATARLTKPAADPGWRCNSSCRSSRLNWPALLPR